MQESGKSSPEQIVLWYSSTEVLELVEHIAHHMIQALDVCLTTMEENGAYTSSPDVPLDGTHSAS